MAEYSTDETILQVNIFALFSQMCAEKSLLNGNFFRSAGLSMLRSKTNFDDEKLSAITDVTEKEYALFVGACDYLLLHEAGHVAHALDGPAFEKEVRRLLKDSINVQPSETWLMERNLNPNETAPILLIDEVINNKELAREFCADYFYANIYYGETGFPIDSLKDAVPSDAIVRHAVQCFFALVRDAELYSLHPNNRDLVEDQAYRRAYEARSSFMERAGVDALYKRSDLMSWLGKQSNGFRRLHEIMANSDLQHREFARKYIRKILFIHEQNDLDRIIGDAESFAKEHFAGDRNAPQDMDNIAFSVSRYREEGWKIKDDLVRA